MLAYHVMSEYDKCFNLDTDKEKVFRVRKFTLQTKVMSEQIMFFLRRKIESLIIFTQFTVTFCIANVLFYNVISVVVRYLCVIMNTFCSWRFLLLY